MADRRLSVRVLGVLRCLVVHVGRRIKPGRLVSLGRRRRIVDRVQRRCHADDDIPDLDCSFFYQPI